MSEHAKQLTWAGGTHAFDLMSPRVSWMLRQDQHPFPGQYGSTPAACLRRFDESVYSPEDVERVFRFALIGGGMAESGADTLIEEQIRGKPIAPFAAIAFEILAIVFFGVTADASAST